MLRPEGPLRGQRVLVTAGPTYEDIDPVRYIGNRSSGRMGFAIAAEAARRGARGDARRRARRRSRRRRSARSCACERAAEMHDAVLVEGGRRWTSSSWRRPSPTTRPVDRAAQKMPKDERDASRSCCSGRRTSWPSSARRRARRGRRAAPRRLRRRDRRTSSLRAAAKREAKARRSHRRQRRLPRGRRLRRRHQRGDDHRPGGAADAVPCRFRARREWRPPSSIASRSCLTPSTSGVAGL